MRLIRLKGIRTKIRLVITLPSFPMKLAAMWLTPPPLTSTRIETSTKKTFTTFGFSLVDRRPHRHQLQQRHRALRQRRQLQLLLRQRQRQRQRQQQLPLHGLRLLQGPLLLQGGDLLPDRDREFRVFSDP